MSARHNAADVKFPIVSVGEATTQGNWFLFGPGCQAMLPRTMASELREAARQTEAVQLVVHRGVYWLPCAAAGPSANEIPLCATRAAAVVEVAPKLSSNSAVGASDAGGTAPMIADQAANKLKCGRPRTDADGGERGSACRNQQATTSNREPPGVRRAPVDTPTFPLVVRPLRERQSKR